MAATSKEINAKFAYTKSDGSTSSGSKNFTGLQVATTVDTGKNFLAKYSGIVDGSVTSAVLKSVEPIDVD